MDDSQIIKKTAGPENPFITGFQTRPANNSLTENHQDSIQKMG